MIYRTEKGYIAFQEENRIVISMPQTAKSVRSSALPISNRKEELSEVELALLAVFVQGMMEDNEHDAAANMQMV